MSNLVFTHARLVRPLPPVGQVQVDDPTDLVIRDGVFSGMEPTRIRDMTRIDVGGRLVTPGLVEPHTHAIFLGDRADEFCARAAGTSYLELARRGGGIRATVDPTRAGSSDERQAALRRRLKRLLAQGVTTAEVKSGYGLSVESELALLRDIAAVRHSGAGLPRITPTLMAAHAIPPEVQTAAEREAWVRRIADELIPQASAEGIADRIDVFVEQTAYTPAEARLLVDAARTSGLGVHLHVDQLTAGAGAELAADWGVDAAAHLEKTSPEGVTALSRSGTVAILIPTSTRVAREPAPAPARALVQAGVPIALSTNVNPGTGPSESTALSFFLAAVDLQLTSAEILWAWTRGGAQALRSEAGTLEAGRSADFVVWNATSIAHLPYHAGINHVRQVWMGGVCVLDRSADADAACEGIL